MDKLIEEGKLIADFLGWDFSSGVCKVLSDKDKAIAFNWGGTADRLPIGHGVVYEHELYNFSYSWDWLMLAIEKISEFKYEDGDTAYPRTFGMKKHDSFMFRFNRCSLFKCETLMEAAYLAVVDFIKSYNYGK